MSLAFYENLKPIDQFAKVADRERFAKAPSDWCFILTDIQGSTAAIEAGRYKDVNLMGAAAIAAIQNVIGTRHFPFAFGGDGATILLPNDLCEKVRPALRRLQRLSGEEFGLFLRIGIVPIQEIERWGGEVLVGKYQMAPHTSLALFQGGGMQLAEKFLKKDPRGQMYWLESEKGEEAPPLETLSCRWAPIASRHGTIVSILIQAVNLHEASQVYQSLLAKMNPVFDAETFRPMAHQQLRPDDFFQGLRREISLRQDLSLWGVFRRIVVPMIFARLSRRFPFLPGFHVFDTYVQSYTTHTDYKKFDDVLRMVLDCSIDQVKQLETLLQESHARGEIFYGIHRSPSALMTCIVEGLGDGEHIHFIDGSDGGYAMAAKELKRQAQRYMEKAG